jgi:DNA-binding response OmpR family regulator
LASSLLLIVDDDASIRRAVAEFLDAEGYRTQTATNGQEALDQVAQERPGLVVLDLRMPILDGWAFARGVVHERQQGLKILVMTAAVDAGQSASDIQADGYLAKPFDLEVLLAEVKRLCPASLP